MYMVDMPSYVCIRLGEVGVSGALVAPDEAHGSILPSSSERSSLFRHARRCKTSALAASLSSAFGERRGELIPRTLSLLESLTVKDTALALCEDAIPKSFGTNCLPLTTRARCFNSLLRCAVN
eukprot:CAMPEP_0185831046 /NCGR_PEP_ID=MMETSP1353-20130828/1252_1 /TAXON_ID=1077150 /ORGANISM="Erythrolobus australicus, Strain CCMP3124" /LENGTH=122 /DNA_ID=CAMNT_0028529063 /DNA_START=537 /DNA_END=902 /DNA_ORIENTATION=+